MIGTLARDGHPVENAGLSGGTPIRVVSMLKRTGTIEPDHKSSSET